MKIPLRTLLAIAAFSLSLFPAFAGGWGDNYKVALATAAKENKKILLDFTGTGWCPACVQLEHDVFVKQQFKEFADKNLVLLSVEIMPVGKTLSPEVIKQNDALLEKYQIEGFPSLVLLDSHGNEIKRQIGSLYGGPKGFIDWVNSAK